MTKVTFFEDFHCFEYHSPQGTPQRFRYYLYSPVYESIPMVAYSLTHWEYSREKTVYTSDFLPSRIAWQLKDG
jgi:hypothetical protein